MVMTYRRPGVYLEESLLINPRDTAGSTTVGAFVGVAEKGPINTAVSISSWSDYSTLFGGFGPFTPPAGDAIATQVVSYLPYSVYSFFQNGGREAYIVRAAPTAANKGGTPATIAVNGQISVPLLTSFNINAKSAGVWGNNLMYNLITQSTVTVNGAPQSVFAIQVLLKNAAGTYEVVETFTGLSVSGSLPGTRRVDSVINDQFSGSQYITISALNGLQPQPRDTTSGAVALATGADPGIPDSSALISAANNLATVEGPINVNICGYSPDASKIGSSTDVNFVGATIPSSFFPGREDVMIINDSLPPRLAGQTSSAYSTSISSPLGVNPGDSYSASYGPWITIPDPQRIGSTVDIPPGGAIIGMIARIDATIGVFRAPAGIVAGLSNALGVQSKFTDTELGDLNSRNINVIRNVVGAGVCCMGARTRKTYGADRYISARRTLIFLKESLRRSTQWAVFENNDQRLWSGLRMTADRILRPVWEAGGLAGASSAEAYQIVCNETINTPSVIQSGEVRMEVGVALEYPAEFVVIRITQYDRGSVASEINPATF